jgi:hypothetical protein
MKLWTKYLLILIFSFFSSIILAQTNEELAISPDRPGVGTPPSVVPKNHFQIETGFLFEQSNDNDIKTNVYSYNQSLFRFGLFSFAELRLSGDYTKTTVKFPMSDSTVLGFGPINIGTKISIYKGKGIIPKTALLVNLTLPKTGKEEYRSANLAPSVYLLFQNSISDKLALGYNIGLEWDGETSKPTTFYAVNLGYSFTDKFSVFVEHYGYLISGANTFYFDGGIAYLLTNKLQLDTYAGIDAKGANKDLQFNVGLSWLIP